MPWLSLVGMLFCTGAILFFAYWATKKIGTSGVGRIASGAQMRVWNRLSIGQNQALLMVQIGERWFVLATTRENVSKVAELTAEEAELWQKQAPSQGTGLQSAAFLETLTRKLRGKDDENKRG